jgi:hypothetical protein
MTALPAPALGPIRSILRRLGDMSTADQVSVRDILEEFGQASFATALIVPALIVVSPLSGIFFLPTVMGLTMVLIAVQMLVGRRSLWLPGFLLRRSIAGARLARAALRLERPAAWFDRQTRERLTIFITWPVSIVPQVGCVVAGLMMPFLELVPLSSSILGGAITLFAVSFLSRDGLFVLLGLISVAVASMIPLFVFYRFG